MTQRVDARRIELEVTGDANEIDRAGAACDFAYDNLTGISEAILRSRPTGLVDVAIQAQIIARRDADLGRPCTDEEISDFSRKSKSSPRAREVIRSAPK